MEGLRERGSPQGFGEDAWRSTEQWEGLSGESERKPSESLRTLKNCRKMDPDAQKLSPLVEAALQVPMSPPHVVLGERCRWLRRSQGH